jgi:GT2 family glycosyltransferase/glycosyltransferase involved in cell wall biosynthesis
MSRVPIDIVVPVYNAPDDLARCIESVLTHTNGDYRLIVIDDASPDTGVQACFARLETRHLPQLALLANERNLGFTLNANRGIAAARPQSDVVLLNSDTVVTGGWLAALARCAASDPSIGTITPFSNNAEICSLPRFCQNNPWPPSRDAETMARALERAAVPTYPDLPTGVGFCLYIRRALIDSIGMFNPVFGLGYGEENDLCMRASAAGFRNVLCEDAFVLHLGGSSFGDKRNDLAERNMQILLERHPRYLDQVRAYIAADPARPLRELALSQYRVLSERVPGVLHVIHGHGGGTEYHVRALIAASSAAFRHYLLIAVGDQWQLEEHATGDLRTYDFDRLPAEPWSDFLGGICGRFGIDLIHLHNISGCRDGLLQALSRLDTPYGYTVHDLNFACPTITFLNEERRYCGAVTDPVVCAACLAAQPEFSKADIVAWRTKHRGLLAHAAFVIAPSVWAASILNKYFPEHEVTVIPHGTTAGMSRPDAVRSPRPMADDGRPVVAVLGAIGPDKGARRLERLIELTRERRLALRWVLIGYLDRGREPFQSADGVFTMHGPYDSRELRALIEHYRVKLAAYPSVGPETFSFTLSEVWAAGRPAIVPPIGALADRVAETGAGWVLTEDEWRSEALMLDRIAAVLEPSRARDFAEAAARAQTVVQPSLEAMTSATIGVYRSVPRPATPSRAAAPPISAARCLAALHYSPWHPPKVVSAEPTAAASVSSPLATGESRDPLAHVAEVALRIRHTRTGRALYRLAPASLVAALKARLPR